MGTGLSKIATEVDHAFVLIAIVSIVMLLGITAAMIYFVIRYSREKNREVSQIDGHLGLELFWVVLPTIIVTWMFFVGYKGFLMMREPPADAMVVKVIARQWAWQFVYEEHDVTSSEMWVPVNRPVKAVITVPADDVLHSFYLPDFRVKEDAVPGQETYLWFESEREGTYNIFCAEYCGKDHSAMLSLLHVVSDDAFQEWVESEQAKRYRPLEYDCVTDSEHVGFSEEQLDIDREKLYGTYCASCHGAAGDGSGLPGVARDFTKTDGWKNGRKVSEIYKTLMEGVSESRMRPFPNFTPWEMVALAHQVREFDKSAPPETARADYDALISTYELDKITGPKKTISVDRAMEILSSEARAAGSEPRAQ